MLCGTLLILVYQTEQIVRIEVARKSRIVGTAAEILRVAADFKIQRLIKAHAAHIAAEFDSVVAEVLGDVVGPLERVSDLRQFSFKVIPDGKAACDGNVRHSFP